MEDTLICMNRIAPIVWLEQWTGFDGGFLDP